MDKQGGRARRLQHARARQGDHHVHGGLMSDMHFSGMLINDIFSRSVLTDSSPSTLAAGGEAGPVHSAGLKIVDRLGWPLVDLRVDWAEDDPVGQLERLWGIYWPQAGHCGDPGPALAQDVQQAVDAVAGGSTRMIQKGDFFFAARQVELLLESFGGQGRKGLPVFGAQ